MFYAQCDSDVRRQGKGGGGVFQTDDVGQGGGGSKKSVFGWTSLMDDPLAISGNYFFQQCDVTLDIKMDINFVRIEHVIVIN